MPKLKLNLETLRVDSFEPAEAGTERGTVMGRAEITASEPQQKTTGDTCDRSCWEGCELTRDSCYVTWCYEVCWNTIDRARG